MKTAEMIQVLQAYAEGKKIQCRNRDDGDDKWVDLAVDPAWNFQLWDYRVKPEPREFVLRNGTGGFRGWECVKGGGMKFEEEIHVREVL